MRVSGYGLQCYCLFKDSLCPFLIKQILKKTVINGYFLNRPFIGILPSVLRPAPQLVGKRKRHLTKIRNKARMPLSPRHSSELKVSARAVGQGMYRYLCAQPIQ